MTEHEGITNALELFSKPPTQTSNFVRHANYIAGCSTSAEIIKNNT